MSGGWDAVTMIARARGLWADAIDAYWNDFPELWVDKLYDGYYDQ